MKNLQIITNNKLKINQRGFTVLESIIAIFVLSLSVSGAFSAVQQSFSQAIIAKDEVKAFYLAQEAIEIIINKRDSNQIDKIRGGASTWLSGITDASNCPFGNICRADATTDSLVLCGNEWDSCPVLNQDQTTYLYNYSTGNASIFKREIQIESINANEIAVTVRIHWTKGLTSKEFKVKTHLFNWI